MAQESIRYHNIGAFHERDKNTIFIRAIIAGIEERDSTFTRELAPGTAGACYGRGKAGQYAPC